LITYQCYDIHSRGAPPFPETQNRGLKFIKIHLEFPEFCEIVNKYGRKEIYHEKNMQKYIKVGKGRDDPKKYKSMSFPSGVTNFYYENTPLRIGELSLGLYMPVPRQKNYKWTLTSL